MEVELTLWSHHQHLHTRFYPDQFDWVDAGCDVVGIASDFVPGMQPLSVIVDLLSLSRSVTSRYQNPHNVDASLDVTVEVLPKAAGMVPGMSSLFDLQSLVLNLSRATESTP